MDKESLKTQVGGSHYSSMAMQPIELIAQLKCSFFQANIIKYISRFKSKNGKQDIEKSIHYAQLAIDLEDKRAISNDNAKQVAYFCKVNGLSTLCEKIITEACYDNFGQVIRLCRKLIMLNYGSK